VGLALQVFTVSRPSKRAGSSELHDAFARSTSIEFTSEPRLSRAAGGDLAAGKNTL